MEGGGGEERRLKSESAASGRGQVPLECFVERNSGGYGRDGSPNTTACYGISTLHREQLSLMRLVAQRLGEIRIAIEGVKDWGTN